MRAIKKSYIIQHNISWRICVEFQALYSSSSSFPVRSIRLLANLPLSKLADSMERESEVKNFFLEKVFFLLLSKRDWGLPSSLEVVGVGVGE